MAGIKIIRKLPLFFCIIILGLLSCGDEYFFDDVDCSECYIPKPDYGPVSVSLTINQENSRIPIKIFKGKYEESFLGNFNEAVVMDTVTENNVSYDLPVNEYYSVAAEYMENGKKVIVVDGDKLKLYRVSDNCDDVCWIFRGGSINATLKK